MNKYQQDPTEALNLLAGRKRNDPRYKDFLKNIIERNQDHERKRKEQEAFFKDFVPSIDKLSSIAIQEFLKDDDKKLEDNLDDYVKMVEKDPFVRSCCEVKALRATIAFGKYQHPNKAIQQWVNDNFNSMQSSLHMVIGQLCSAMPFGFSVAEIQFYPRRDKTWGIKGFRVLDPRRVTFEGSRGDIVNVVYKMSNGKSVKIPYKKCIHVVAGYTTNFNNPYGSPECRRAYPYYKAKQTILAELTIAAKNSATGIWLGYTDPNTKVQLYGPDGRPLKNSDGTPMVRPAMEALMRQLQNLENNAVVVTDMNNRIETIRTGADAGLWSFALNFFNQGIVQAFNIPMGILSESQALWGGTLNNLQKSTLDCTVEAIVKQIKDEILEKAIRPLLHLNFNEIEELGDFEEVIVNDPMTKSAHLQNIVTAISMQLVDGNDPDVQNKIRELLNLPILKETKEKGRSIMSRNVKDVTEEIRHADQSQESEDVYDSAELL